MTDRQAEADERSEATRLQTAALLAAALLALAGALLWWKFGSTVFVDLLAMTLSCF